MILLGASKLQGKIVVPLNNTLCRLIWVGKKRIHYSKTGRVAKQFSYLAFDRKSIIITRVYMDHASLANSY
jgi:hypothetical protein